MRVHHQEADLENHDLGLQHDLPLLLARRRLLKLVAGAGIAGTGLISLGACSSATTTSGPSPGDGPGGPGGPPPGGGGPGSGGQPQDTSDTANGELPEETAGPYPGDGSNGANVLTQSGVVRSDITTSFGSSTTRAEGIPLSVTMTIRDFSAGKKAMVGAAVYVWHCNRAGEYSLYSEAVKQENYLRGVQATDGKGQVHFTTIVPACYSGRWPHIHFEVYPSLAKATNSADKVATSQMAMPKSLNTAVFATPGYEQSVTNLAQVSLERDMVFGDGYDLQIPTVTGDVTNGFALTFDCAV